jgi:catechol 2,3-dioxygenase-like lactoylglutathione lyase family enzyme
MAFSATTDGEGARAFYGEKLGLKLVEDSGFALVFDAGGTMLRVQKVKEVPEGKYTALGWEVPDIAAKVEELAAAGVKFEHYGFPGQDEKGIWTPPGARAKVAWFKDPDGNILSLTQF